MMHMVGGACVAVKSPARDCSKSMRSLQNEVQLLHMCSACPNVVRVYGLLGPAPCRKMVMEAAEESLDERLKAAVRSTSSRVWEMHERMVIALGVAAGLEHIHSLGIIHADLKPQNVLLVGRMAKLCDFGMAHYHPPADADGERKERPLLRKAPGTLHWFPPEHLRAYALAEQHAARQEGSPGTSRGHRQSDDRLAAANDVWAFGCVLECLGESRRRPSHVEGWDGRCAAAGYRYIAQTSWQCKTPPKGLHWHDVLSATTALAAKERPSMSSVRIALMGKHQFVTSTNGPPKWADGPLSKARSAWMKEYEQHLSST
jgi:serine/threonine protein kinase